jgi:hypothetical protein
MAIDCVRTGSTQTYPEGPTAEHERKGSDNQKQGNSLRIDPWKGLALVFGAHYELTNDNARKAVITTSATMITKSGFFAGRFMATFLILSMRVSSHV